MNEKEFKESAPYIFVTGIKGIFSILPIKRLIKEVSFIVSLCLAIIFSIVAVIFCNDKMLDIIEKIIDLIIAIVPAILGLSLAGFAIVISQINTETLERTADIQKKNEKTLRKPWN